jgi:hypothetical protein
MTATRRPLMVNEGERNTIRRWLRTVFRGRDDIVVTRQADGLVEIGRNPSVAMRNRGIKPPLELGIVRQDDGAGQQQGGPTTGSTIEYAIFKPGDDTSDYANAVGRHLQPEDRETPGRMTIAADGTPCLYYREKNAQGDAVVKLYDVAKEMPVTTTCDTGGG